MSKLFRCAGDVLFDNHEPLPGHISSVQLKKFSETSNFLQSTKPLTPEHPHFFAQIRSSAPHSKIILGIAGPDIDGDAQPGHWNYTVGYHSDTGKCFSSHANSANTKGEKYSIGDVFGVLVTYFGDTMSTVLFLKNGLPVATRYLFEADHNKYLPTISLEHGPVDVEVMWPQAVIGAPRFDERDMQNWIKDSGVQYDQYQNLFKYDKELPEVTLQSPTPLNKDMVHYEVIIKETEGGESPAVGIATCSPLQPPPTCILLRDFFRWKADGKDLQCHVGQRIGFGIHYNPEYRAKINFDDKKQQLVLCFVTIDMQIVFFRMMLQPPGGFYPLIILTKGASQVQLDVETNRDLGDDGTIDLLDNLYQEKFPDALKVLNEDIHHRIIPMSLFRKSDDVEVDIKDSQCIVSLKSSTKGIHVIQYQVPLKPESAYFCIEIIKLNEDSVLSIGVADAKFPLNKHPGKCLNSTGYVSRDGRMYFNTKYTGSIEGERFHEGDTVGLEVRTFSDCGYSVILFIKNERPIGTRYVSVTDLEQLFPTVSLYGNGYDIRGNVQWQNRISQGPIFKFIGNLEHWCLPGDCTVDTEEHIVTVKDHSNPVSIQCPNSLNESFNHFEVQIIDPFGGSKPQPPVIALTAAYVGDCVQQPHKMSNFSLDYLRFWAIDEAEQAIQVGDLIGWGMLIPPSQIEEPDRMVICYLTINRNIVLTRVIFEPQGGLFPIVVLPGGVNRVKLEFSAVRIISHPISEELVVKLLNEAQELYKKEQEHLKLGKHLDDFVIDRSDLLKPLPEDDTWNSKENGDGLKLNNIVMKTKGLERVQKAVKNYRDSSNQSKACVIL